MAEIVPAPRRFYVVGHNTNSIAEVKTGLARGMNAFEIDISHGSDGGLWVSHEAVNVGMLPSLAAKGFETPLELDPFLDLFAAIVERSGDDVALLMVDCKVSHPGFAPRLR